MPDPTISYPWADEAQTMVDFQKVKVNGELATDLMEQQEIDRLLNERAELIKEVGPVRAFIKEKEAELIPMEERIHEIELALINEYDRRKAQA